MELEDGSNRPNPSDVKTLNQLVIREGKDESVNIMIETSKIDRESDTWVIIETSKIDRENDTWDVPHPSVIG